LLAYLLSTPMQLKPNLQLSRRAASCPLANRPAQRRAVGCSCELGGVISRSIIADLSGADGTPCEF
jgi:hypothetical protein